MIIKNIFIPLLLFNARIAISQCPLQVEHISGTVSIGGTNVTVSSFGLTDTNTVYCPNTYPYFIGYEYGVGSGDGGYSFSFSPPIDCLTFNVSGLSYLIGVSQEVLVTKINNVHYSVPFPGTFNGCDPLAALTAEGDISGNGNVSGWNGTTIYGPISNLILLDSAIMGFGNGCIVSLFISDYQKTDIFNNNSNGKIEIYPNPFNDELNIFVEDNLIDAEISIFNALGVQVFNEQIGSGVFWKVNCESLDKGIFYINVIDKKNAEKILSKVIIKN